MLQTALIFQDHMILQREKPVRIWGKSAPGVKVTVQIQGTSASCEADGNGNWSVQTGPFRTSFSETMRITRDGEELLYTDIQIGDVWLAAGQSNMEFHMRYDADLPEALADCTNDDIRFFDYPEVSYPEQLREADYRKNFGFWRKACPEDLQWFSAVAYYFARDIRHKYQIPVGIVGCNWGGTPACAWMSEAAITEGGGRIWLEEYREALRHLDVKSYDEAFRNNPGSYRVDPFANPFNDLTMKGVGLMDVLRTITGQEPDLSQMDFSALMPAMGPKNETRPCGLYESMLTQIAPFGMRGILYYQGETDGDRHPELYSSLFPALIRCFRDLWQEELPFLFVQLAPFGQWMQCYGEPYTAIREAQQHTAETVPGTGMAVISDIGMEYDIHPKKKQPVGHRLALLAMVKVYGESILCEAPAVRRAVREKNELVLSFDNAGDGLYLADRTPDGATCDPHMPGGMKILKNGQEIDLASLTVSVQEDTLRICGDILRDDAAYTVEFGCCGWYRINLYNSADLPLRPGRVAINK